jgi:cell division protease FtsH
VRTASGFELWAAYPTSDAQTQGLLERLQRGGARVTVDQQSDKPLRTVVVQFLLPILILVCLFAFFTRLSAADGGAAASRPSRTSATAARRRAPTRSPSTRSPAPASRSPSCARSATTWPTRRSTRSFGAGAPKGVLLVGPPGTGKTLLARATAGEADARSSPCRARTSSSRSSASARPACATCSPRRARPRRRSSSSTSSTPPGASAAPGVGQGNDEREQTLNQLLVEMDGFGGDLGVVVLGATNRPDILDPALLRPGRFDRQVVVDVPDVHGRIAILNLHARGKPIGRDADLHEIAKLTPGLLGRRARPTCSTRPRC